ncbi:MAG: DUF4838 domain-containing protein [Abditibacteriota bacterium]|nr:DUF4838 domain-containing protein [Abditibacteriota bacterium]
MMRVGHAFESELLPGSKYFKEHPEWFALRDGVRRPVQPCLSDPEALKEVAANIRREIEELGIRHVAVGLNDNNLYCQCPDCEALAEKYGAQSGVLIHALNHIYDLIKDEYPDVMLETFAYLHTAEPPKGIRPCDHVMIVLCDIENNFGASFTEASSRPLLLPENARYFLYADQQTVNGEYYRRLREWGKITDNLFIWHYVVNFSNYLILHPNLAPFKKDLQAFRDAGAKALFLQGDRHNAYAGFTALRNYLLCRLAWDPDSDEDELMKDFMKGFYGAGWEYIYRIWKYAGEIVEKRNIFISTYCYDDSWLTKEEMAEIFRLFSLALSAASDDKDARYRIYYDLMCFQVAWYLADDETRDYCAKSGWMGITDPERFARYFLNFARNNGIVEFSEGGPIENSILSGYRPKEKSGSVPSVCEGLADDEWIELLPDDFAIIQKGALADVLEDPEAVTGRACVLYSATVEWNMASGLSKLLFYLSDRGYRTCDVYVSAKRAGEMADPEADALQVITWEPVYGLEKTFKARELGKSYSLLSAGSFEIKRRPNADMFLYPLNKPEGCREVWIDRVILIPRK